MTLLGRLSTGLLSIGFAVLSACGTEEEKPDRGSAGAAGTLAAGTQGVGAGTGGRASGGSAGRQSAGGRATGGGRSGSEAGTSSGAGSDGMAGDPGSAGSGPGAGDCGTITTFEASKTPTNEVHVATNGSDSTGDGSDTRPFATIERAARGVGPGTAIRVHAGTYAEETYLEGLAGSEAEPIWLGGVPGEARPVLSGGAQALHLVRARWVIVHDLEVRGQTANGINADDGGERADPEATHSLIFRNLSIHDVGSGGNQDCLKLSGINSYYVLDSTFARCGGGSSGSAIDHVGCHDGLIARNEFSDLSGGNAVQCKGASRNIEVRWNRIRSGGQRAVNLGGSTGFEFFRPPLATGDENAEARDIKVIANVIEGGIAALGFVGCVDCMAANNTIVNPDNWVLRILQETTSSDGYEFAPARNGRFVNNLVYFDRGALSTTINVGANTEADSFVFQNNLWYAHDDPARSRPTDLPAAESDGIYGQDPDLDASFAIAASSPAAAAGTAVSELVGDITGRCYADQPSIGAYQAR